MEKKKIRIKIGEIVAFTDTESEERKYLMLLSLNKEKGKVIFKDLTTGQSEEVEVDQDMNEYFVSDTEIEMSADPENGAPIDVEIIEATTISNILYV